MVFIFKKHINKNNIKNVRTHFPIFKSQPNLVYLDSAATNQRPQSIVAAQSHFELYENANIHRGVYDLSNKSSQKFEKSRSIIAAFLGSKNSETVAFTQGTTAAINIVARSYLEPRLKSGDNIVTTVMEHHANFIPWQMLCKKYGIELRVVPIDQNGDLDMMQLKEFIDHHTQLVAVTHISNTLGTINPIADIIAIAHAKEVPVLIDAAQSISHFDISIEHLDYDFLVFSGHKMFGPFGIGILQVAEKHIQQMLPLHYGGGMIKQVTIENTQFRDFPYNLDAGTPNISGVIGISAAAVFIDALGKKNMRQHLEELTYYALDVLAQIPELTIVGTPKKQAGIISFNAKNIHPHDVASFLNKDGIALRAGMHCTQPLLAQMGLQATARISFSVYNTKEEIDLLALSLRELIKFWS